MSCTTFAEYLRARRKAHGHTQVTLSELLGISQSELSRLELGQDLPTWDQLGGLGRELGGRHVDGEQYVEAFSPEHASRLIMQSQQRSAS